jgi:predicted nucleotidyltransferase component of viral defense system
MSLDPETVNDIAAELGIDPALVEKDWYSIRVLKYIAEMMDDDITAIFSGGTSLSKGHGLIKRFSEDLDFRAKYNFSDEGRQIKRTHRAFRKKIGDILSAAEGVAYNQVKLDAGSNYFKFPLAYTRQFGDSDALRPQLQIEFSFTQPRLAPVIKPISSFIASFTNTPPETEILCLNPVEIAADKLSALTWRIIKRNRSDPQDDPAMIRHLHDLCALNAVIKAEAPLFRETALSSFAEDQQTRKRCTDRDFKSSMQSALSALRSDKKYKQEYIRFVDAMSYADEDEQIVFETALTHFEVLFEKF